MKLSTLLRIAVAAAASAYAALAAAQRTPIAQPHPIPSDVAPRVALEQCGDFVGHFGPLDFRVIHPLDRRNVETNHFEMELRTFLSGRLAGKTKAGTGDIMGGINYTLKAIPNHPAALLVVEQIGRRLKTDDFGEYPLECYYLRAFMIAPDDPAVRTMYGTYLGYRGREAEALTNLKLADDQSHGRPSLQHHIGLAYLQLKRYDLAQACAMRAARLNFPVDSLEKALRKANKWDDKMVLPPESAEPADGDDAATPAAAAAAASEPLAAASGAAASGTTPAGAAPLLPRPATP